MLKLWVTYLVSLDKCLCMKLEPMSWGAIRYFVLPFLLGAVLGVAGLLPAAPHPESYSSCRDHSMMYVCTLIHPGECASIQLGLSCCIKRTHNPFLLSRPALELVVVAWTQAAPAHLSAVQQPAAPRLLKLLCHMWRVVLMASCQACLSTTPRLLYRAVFAWSSMALPVCL